MNTNKQQPMELVPPGYVAELLGYSRPQIIKWTRGENAHSPMPVYAKMPKGQCLYHMPDVIAWFTAEMQARAKRTSTNR